MKSRAALMVNPARLLNNEIVCYSKLVLIQKRLKIRNSRQLLLYL